MCDPACVTWGQLERDELLTCTDDPFVRYAAPRDALAVAGPSGWACLLRWRAHGHWGGAAAVGPGAGPAAESEAFAVLTRIAADQGVVPEWFSTAPGRELEVPAGLRVRGSGRWAFLWTTAADGLPPAPDGLVELDDAADAEEIEAFGRQHNGSFEGFPGRGYSSLWLGVRQGGLLCAVGALHVLASGAPHLAGIVVRPDLRGQGLGAGVTAELTRRAVAAHGVATLGVYSDNWPALRVYERLGYAAAHHFDTRDLEPVGSDLR